MYDPSGNPEASTVPLHIALSQRHVVINSSVVARKTNGAVTPVKGSWVVPAVTGTGYGSSAAWVSIDGDQSYTVEQIGTDSDTAATAAWDGTPQYFAWYEMYPA